MEYEREAAMYMKAFQVAQEMWKVRKQGSYNFDLLAMSTHEDRFRHYLEAMLPGVSLARVQGEHSHLLYVRATWTGPLTYVNVPPPR